MIKIILPLILLGTAGILFVHPMLIASQNQPHLQLNNVIQDVLKAESAGAQLGEMRKLTTELNSVIDLRDQLQNLSPQETDKRSQLLVEINNTLARVDTEANKITIIASQRTFTDHLVMYSFAGIGAVLATIVSHYAFSVWRKYRAKRALGLTIVSK